MFNKDDNQGLSEALIIVRRVSKTVTGGSISSFSSLIVVGDSKGRFSIGQGKAREVSLSRDKASLSAKKRMCRVSLKGNRTTHYDCSAHYGSSHVMLRSAPPGTGIIASNTVRSMLEMVGIHDAVTKLRGSTNPINVAKAMAKLLNNLSSPKRIAERRNQHISEIIRKRNIMMSGNSRRRKATDNKE